MDLVEEANKAMDRAVRNILDSMSMDVAQGEELERLSHMMGADRRRPGESDAELRARTLKILRGQATPDHANYQVQYKVGCSHEMKLYVGFTEKYRYCTKCDHKEK